MKRMHPAKILIAIFVGVTTLPALAACPSDPLRANGGAWSAKSVIQASMNVVSGGLVGTACRLQVGFATSPSTIAKAFVSDTSPRVEPRYRARFYIDTTEVSVLGVSGATLRIFSVAGSSYPNGGRSDMVDVTLVGAQPAPFVKFDVADITAKGLYNTVIVPLPVSRGANRIEIDLSVGKNNPNGLRYWVNAAGDGSTDANPTGVLAIADNTAWGGINQANLGAITASTIYLTTTSPLQHLYFDEFNSRRQSFIGP
jgi:hypothetical protein